LRVGFVVEVVKFGGAVKSKMSKEGEQHWTAAGRFYSFVVIEVH
jgi:hypothetical protein